MELKVEQVALLVGVSVRTLNSWYWFKENNPTNEYAQMLPPFERKTAKGTRYWKSEDIPNIIKFRAELPHGRNGILGDVTQRYSRKVAERKKEASDAKEGR